MTRFPMSGFLLCTLPLALVLPRPEPGPAAHGAKYRGNSQPWVPPPQTYFGPKDSTRTPRDTSGTPAPFAGPRSAPPGPAGAPPGATSGNSFLFTDPTTWNSWWEFNKDFYLDLRTAIHAAPPTTGSEDFFLGSGTRLLEGQSLAPLPEDVEQVVLPALLAALEGGTNPDVVTSCLVALAKLGNDLAPERTAGLAEAIAARLPHPVQEVRETAAVALGILGREDSIDTLEALLDDTAHGQRLVGTSEVSYRTRAFAAYGLGLIGHRTSSDDAKRRVVELLVRALDAEDTATSDLGVSCVIALGLVPVPNFMPLDDSRSEPWDSRREEIEVLLRVLGSGSRGFLVRAQAPVALVKLLAGLPPEVTRYYKDRVARTLMSVADARGTENEVRQSAVAALGRLGDADDERIDLEIRTWLRKAATEPPDAITRSFALIALGQVGADPRTRGAAGAEDIRAFLEERLFEGATPMRPWAGLALAILGGGRVEDDGTVSAAGAGSVAARALRRAFESEKQPTSVAAYAISLGILGDAQSSPLLLERLEKTSEQETLGYLAVALGLVGDRSAIEPLRALVRTSRFRPELMRQAATALGLLGDKDAVPTLLEELKESKSLATQGALASSLGVIGDRRSVVPLVEMLADADLTDRARALAAAALGLVCDQDRLPWNSEIARGLNYRATTSSLYDAQGLGVLDIL